MSQCSSTHHGDVKVGGVSTSSRWPGQLGCHLFQLLVPTMAGSVSYSIVEYFGGDDGYRCGYCKNEKGNFSHGKFIIKEQGNAAGQYVWTS